MKLKEPKNKNYCATIVKVSNIFPLENCDNVQGALVTGYQVIVSKDTKVNDIGVFFPVECKLSEEYLSNNNLFRHSDKNINKDKKGYFEDNCRLKCMKFRQHKSEGLFMPLSSFSYVCDPSSFSVGDEFDEINDKVICQKYFIERRNVSLSKSDKRNKKVKRISRLVENQFRLHIDTEQLKKNMFKIKPDDICSISTKFHGSSIVVGNVLVKRKLSIIEKIAKLFGVSVKETEYGNVYSSRNVVKNAYDDSEKQGFYAKDIWKEVNDSIKELIPKGFSVYGEIVGYVQENSFIQKGYHYGCHNGTKELYVYRITQTNEDGFVYELTRPEIDEFCNRTGLKATPLLYYGKAKDIYPDISIDEHWHANLLNRLDKDEALGMNDVMCKYNNNEVPSEGVVLRIERMFSPEPYKLKNYKFLIGESKMMDNGEIDIESEN